MEMVERVAVAISLADDKNGSGCDVPAYYRKLARAAIAAMREPTNDMVMAGGDAGDEHGMAAETVVWRAMIDSALSTK